ncbi:DUF5133 domain-containing protein [Streptomyces sp. So13.3]|nr:DUF5133 domain-containing protein [Streptomyces sp. So13.3]
MHARLSSPLKGPTRLIHEDHSAFSGTFGPSRIRGPQSTLGAEQQALAHSATSNPDLHRRLQDVSYTLRVSTGARDIDDMAEPRHVHVQLRVGTRRHRPR